MVLSEENNCIVMVQLKKQLHHNMAGGHFAMKIKQTSIYQSGKKRFDTGDNKFNA